jgi:putative membrane protein
LDDRVPDGSQTAPSEAWDAVRRTRLAAERTELAWWRTALTSIAVAVGVGRVEAALDSGEMIPSSRGETRWLMIGGVVLCLATVGLIAAPA